MTNHAEILERIKDWKIKYEELDKRIRRISTKGASTKEEKDKKIKERHILSLERDYWRGKYQRFVMESVPEGFARRQSTDANVIARYARMYLKSVFRQVYVVKGLVTSDFRKLWGIQDEKCKKERVNHVHHCIDAITIACIGKDEYDQLAQFHHAVDEHRWDGKIKKPWNNFVQDIQLIQEELLVAHYSKDNLPKQTRHYIKDSKGNKILAQGDTARASLHNDTYYGAIQRDGEIKYVIRKSLAEITEKDAANIVDDAIRQKVETAIVLHGSLQKAVEATIWMNEEKHIPIKKVRLYAKTVTRPLHIRQHRDVSRHEYKRQYHVQNDRNYMMAIYVGENNKGQEKREFVLVNNLTAARQYRHSNAQITANNQFIPQQSNSKYPLRYKLKIGTMVLLYEKSPQEIWNGDKQSLQKRLYKVTGLSIMVQKYQYGVISLVHHQDARASSDIKLINGAYKNDEDFRSGIRLLHTQFKAFVQGIDFEINDLGEIRQK